MTARLSLILLLVASPILPQDITMNQLTLVRGQQLVAIPSGTLMMVYGKDSELVGQGRFLGLLDEMVHYGGSYGYGEVPVDFVGRIVTGQSATMGQHLWRGIQFGGGLSAVMVGVWFAGVEPVLLFSPLPALGGAAWGLLKGVAQTARAHEYVIEAQAWTIFIPEE